MLDTSPEPPIVFVAPTKKVGGTGHANISCVVGLMKNGNPFTTSISKELLHDLKQYSLKNGYQTWIFPTSARDKNGVKIDKPIHDARSSWKTACAAAGLNGTPHKLRHSFASIMVKNGVDILTVSRLLHHSNISVTTDRYAHLAETAKENTLKEYQQGLGIVGN